MANFKEDAEIVFQKSLEEIEKQVFERFGKTIPEHKFTQSEINIMRFAFMNGVVWGIKRSTEVFSTSTI